MIADRKTDWMVDKSEVVLIHLNGDPAYFARVDSIEADLNDGWWKLEFLLLTMPVERITWVIREEHMAGAQFMIGDTLIRIEQVPPIALKEKEIEPGGKERPPVSTSAKVLPFTGRRRSETRG
jgi:hypothetical protein